MPDPTRQARRLARRRTTRARGEAVVHGAGALVAGGLAIRGVVPWFTGFCAVLFAGLAVAFWDAGAPDV